MWDLSLCLRILQDHEFNGEQNDELCSCYSRTYLSQKQANGFLVKNTKMESTFNFLWDLLWNWKTKVILIKAWNKNTSEETETETFIRISNSCMTTNPIHFLYQQRIHTWLWIWRFRTKSFSIFWTDINEICFPHQMGKKAFNN